MIDIARSLNDTIKSEGDKTRRQLGLTLVELLGRTLLPEDGYDEDVDGKTLQETAAHEFGVGTVGVKRLASIHPLSAGLALVAATAAYGDPNNSGDPVALGRIASGPDDAFGFFFSRKTFTGKTIPVTDEDTYQDDTTLKTTVRIPTNVPTLVIALAVANARVGTDKTQLDAHIRIGGSTTTGSPAIDNLSGAIGPAFSAGLETSWQVLVPIHARTFLIKSSSETVSEQNVNVRWRAFGGSGSVNIRSAWIAGVKIPLG